MANYYRAFGSLRAQGLAEPHWLALAALIGVILALAVCWAIAQRRSKALMLLTGLSPRVSELAASPKALYSLIEEQVRRVTDAPQIFVQLAHSSALQQPTLIANGQRIADPVERRSLGVGPYQWLQENPHQLVLPDTRLASPVQPFQSDPPAASAVFTPLVAEGRLYGAITVQSPQRRAFRRRATAALQLVADQVALGLHTAYQSQKERDTAAQLLMIAEVSRRVAAILDLDELFADTVRLVRETLGYYHVCIFSVDVASREIVLQASSSPLIEQRGLIVPWGHGLIGHAALGETVLVNDVRQDARFLPDAALERTAAELSLPLMVEDRVLGVLDIQSAEAGSFEPGDMSTLRILADQIAVAIEDSHLYRAQQEQAWISTALLRVAEAVAAQTTLEDITSTTERLTRMLTGVSFCRILIWQQDGNVFFLPAEEGDGDTVRPEGRTLLPESVPLAKRVRTLAIAVDGLAEDLGVCRPSDILPEAPAIGLPIITKGAVIGVLQVATDPDVPLPPAQRTILEGIARQAALGLDNATLLASQREEAWFSTALLQVANVISRTSYDLSETVNTIVRLIPMLVGVSWCAILVWDPDRRRYAATSSYGLQVELQDGAQPREISPDDFSWLTDLQARSGITSVIAPLVQDLQLEPASEGETEVLSMPLRAHQRDLGLLFVGNKQPATGISSRRLAILNGIAGQTALAISATRLYQQSVQQQRFEHEMRLARDIQASFLPERCPSPPGWQIAVDWRAARSVGGDYYDLIEFGDGTLGVSIADVSDKGVPAALYMALSRSVLRAAALDSRSPAETLQRANQVLMQDTRSGMFITSIYAIIELETGSVRYVRAGHNPALYVTRDGNVTLLEPVGIALGIVTDPMLVEETFTLEPGDMLVMYTDGVTEAWNESDDEFGMDRLIEVVAGAAGSQAEEVIERIHNAVQDFVGESAQSDDYTVVVVKREGATY